MGPMKGGCKKIEVKAVGLPDEDRFGVEADVLGELASLVDEAGAAELRPPEEEPGPDMGMSAEPEDPEEAALVRHLLSMMRS